MSAAISYGRALSPSGIPSNNEDEIAEEFS
jgi:hypothetical protein